MGYGKDRTDYGKDRTDYDKVQDKDKDDGGDAQGKELCEVDGSARRKVPAPTKPVSVPAWPAVLFPSAQTSPSGPD